MRKLTHSARNKQWEHTTPPTVYVKSDLPASSSQSPKELRGRAHSVDDGRRCAKDLRAARPRTPNEYELFFQACSLEDKSKDDRMPTLLFDESPYEDMCRKASVSHVRLHARAAARYGSSRAASDCSKRLLRALWLLDAVPAPLAPRPTMHFPACWIPSSVVNAFRAKNLCAIKLWLDLDEAHLGARDRKLMGLAHWAVMLQWLPALDELISRCAPLDIRSHKGATPLYVAALMQREDAVRRLLEAKANPNVPDHDGTTPLMVACRAGATGAVLALLDAGASPTLYDSSGSNALMHAVEKKRKGVYMLLRQRYQRTRVWAAMHKCCRSATAAEMDGKANVCGRLSEIPRQVRATRLRPQAAPSE